MWGRAADWAARRPAEKRENSFANLARGAGSFGKPRRGATARAASMHGARQERATRASWCGEARAKITESRASTRREAAGDGRAEDVGREGRPGSEALPAENQENGLRLRRSAGSFGSCGAAQQRGPHPCTAHDKSEQREQRDVARRMARSQSRAQQRAVRPRATDAKQA